MKKLLVAFAAVAMLVLFSGVAEAQNRGRDSYPMAAHVAKQKAEQARQDMRRNHNNYSNRGVNIHSRYGGIDIRVSPYRAHPRSLYYVPSYPRYIPYPYHCPPSHYFYGGGSFYGFGVGVRW